jgi:DNA-directed RNA polymerase subunit RPC12/RpoP
LILDFPTKHDFFNAANDYLNSSWESVIEHLKEFEELREVFEDSDHEAESKRYWSSAKQTLISATALVQQAAEFYIKGRISGVSPYLLISGSPQSWPKGCSKKDIEFSSFRTLDAQDLLKVHDTVYEQRFTAKFIQWFDELRVIRNKIMHTVDKSLSVTPEEVLDLILFAHHYFSQTECWFESRRAYLEKTPVNSMKSIQDDDNYECYILQSLLIDFRISTEVLKPAQIKLYFNFDKKLKSIHCPSCSHKVSKMDFWDHEFIHDCGKTYQKVDSSNVYACRICNHTGSILKKQCSEYDCEGELIDSELGICFSCYGENEL